MIAVILTSNLRLAASPGNVLLSAEETGLFKPSVVNVSQLVAVDKGFLSEYVGELEPDPCFGLPMGCVW